MVLIIIGIVAFGVGGILLLGRKSALAKAQLIRTTPQRNAGELAEMATAIGGQLGPGAYNEYVSLRGKIECGQPLTSELAGTSCVYYSMSVVREYEEEYTEHDSQQQRDVRKTRTGSDTIASNTRSCAFTLRDATGTIDVLPDNADFDAEQVLSRYDPEHALVGGGRFSFGAFSMVMEAFAHPHRRILGYRLTEKAMPVGRDVLVFGLVSDAEGRVAVHQSPDKSQKFLISPKSREAFLKDTQGAAVGYLVGAIVAAVAGIGLVIAGIVT
jgi:hypothetical protein